MGQPKTIWGDSRFSATGSREGAAAAGAHHPGAAGVDVLGRACCAVAAAAIRLERRLLAVAAEAAERDTVIFKVPVSTERAQIYIQS